MEGKTRQRVVCTLGRLDDPMLRRRLNGLVETASRYVEAERLVLSRGVKVRAASWGPYLVWGAAVEEVLKNERASMAVYPMVLHRLCDPGSKVACFRFAQDIYGAWFEDLGLYDLYRALDLLFQGKEEIERGWLSLIRDLFTDLELVYFDTTSTYVEGTHPEGVGELRLPPGQATGPGGSGDPGRTSGGTPCTSREDGGSGGIRGGRVLPGGGAWFEEGGGVLRSGDGVPRGP